MTRWCGFGPRPARPRTTLDLHTGDAARASATFQGLRVELKELQPYPFSSRTIAQGDYRATLTVTELATTLEAAMNRRIAIQSGLLAGLGSRPLAAPSEAAAGAQESDRAVVQALHDIESTLQRQAEEYRNAHWRPVRRVQEQQRTFLKASHRYPEFIEVGARVWEGADRVARPRAADAERDARRRRPLRDVVHVHHVAAAPRSRRQLRGPGARQRESAVGVRALSASV